MEIPDLTIECLRCTNSTKLDVPAMQKDASGEYKPVNAKRPAGWIAGPTPIGEVTKGICPRCAPDWTKLQEAFLTTPPEDESVELRPSFQGRAKIAGGTLNKPVGRLYDTNIAIPVDSTPKPIGIAQEAQIATAPPPAPAAAAPIAAQRTPLRNSRVQMAPLRPTLVDKGPSKQTVMASPAPFGSVKASPIAGKTEAVRVVTHQGARPAQQPVQAQRIAPAAAPPLESRIGLSPPPPRPVAISHATPVAAGAPVRIGGIPQAAAHSPVTMTPNQTPQQAAAPVPSKAFSPGVQRSRSRGVVTTSEPRAIQAEVSAFKASISKPEPIE